MVHSANEWDVVMPHITLLEDRPLPARAQRRQPVDGNRCQWQPGRERPRADAAELRQDPWAASRRSWLRLPPSLGAMASHVAPAARPRLVDPEVPRRATMHPVVVNLAPDGCGNFRRTVARAAQALVNTYFIGCVQDALAGLYLVGCGRYASMTEVALRAHYGPAFADAQQAQFVWSVLALIGLVLLGYDRVFMLAGWGSVLGSKP